MRVGASLLSSSGIHDPANTHRRRASVAVRRRKDTYRTFIAERLLRAAVGVCAFGKSINSKSSATTINGDDDDDDVETLFD
jgi:hypothetical protein